MNILNQFTEEELAALLKAFKQHKHDTAGRKDALGNPIKFLLAFDEWIDVWLQSGRLFERKGFCMSRNYDIGHYEVNNVFIQSRADNSRFAHLGKKRKPGFKKGRIVSESTKKKLSETHLGKKHTDQTRKKMSEVHKGHTYRLVSCIYCKKTGGVATMPRWHLSNCKHRT